MIFQGGGPDPHLDPRVQTVIHSYINLILQVTQDRNWDGKFGDEGYQWTFADALLFSVTVITTIGNGSSTF